MSRRCICTLILISGLVAALFPAPVAVQAGNGLNNPFVIADQSQSISTPSVAYNNQNQEYLVVWCHRLTGSVAIYARQVSKTGQVSTISPVSENTGPIERCSPDVAYNSAAHNYLVVWEQKDGAAFSVRGRLFTPGGTLGAEVTFNDADSSNFVSPAVAYSSTSNEFMVVWAYQPYSGSYSILAQRLSGSGTKLGGNTNIAQGDAVIQNYDPDLAYNPSRDEYLIAWTRLDNGAAGGPNKDIYGQRVTEDLIKLGQPLQVGYFTPQEQHAAVVALPTAAPESGRYLVAWEILYTTGDHDIWARGIKGDGTFLEVINVATSYLDESYPAAAASFNTNSFLVSWTSNYGPAFPLNIGIRARNLALDGQMMAPDWAGGLVAANSATAPGPTGDFLVAYEDTPPFGNTNVYGRLWGSRVYIPIVRK